MLCLFLLYNSVNQLSVYSFPLLPPPRHPSGSSQSPQLGSLCPSHQPLLLHVVAYGCQCQAPISFVPPLPSPTSSVHMSILYFCVSVPALEIGSSISTFHMCVPHTIFAFLFLFSVGIFSPAPEPIQELCTSFSDCVSLVAFLSPPRTVFPLLGENFLPGFWHSFGQSSSLVCRMSVTLDLFCCSCMFRFKSNILTRIWSGVLPDALLYLARADTWSHSCRCWAGAPSRVEDPNSRSCCQTAGQTPNPLNPSSLLVKWRVWTWECVDSFDSKTLRAPGLLFVRCWS